MAISENGISPVVLRPISSAKEYLSSREVAPNFQTNTGETNVMKAADTNLERRILRKYSCKYVAICRNIVLYLLLIVSGWSLSKLDLQTWGRGKMDKSD